MIKKHLLPGILLVFLAAACNHVYREYDKDSFPTMSWKSGQAVTFSPTIDDIEKSYSITLGMRHHYALNVEKFGVQIVMKSPSGKEEVLDVTALIRDAAGEHVGDCMGDICDLEVLVSDRMKFSEAGTYSVTVVHSEDGYQIPGIMEVGLIIDANE